MGKGQTPVRRTPAVLLAALLAVLLIGMIPAGAVSEAADDPGEPATSTDLGPDEKWVIQGDVLIACNCQDEEVTVPAGIREIGPEAFRGLTNLRKVTLPDSVEIIGVRAFADCEHLQQVILTETTKLREIREQAFLNCRELDISFVPENVIVAENAFEGVNPVNPEPEPQPQPEPAPHYGGGGGGGGHRQQHSRNTVPEGPDYDRVAVDKLNGEEPMTQLTIGEEVLELTLEREEKEAAFLATAIAWGKETGEAPDTLLLTAVEDSGEQSAWHLNGTVLRKLYRSGIDHLVLQVGDQIAEMETEGFLAGWEYDVLKSRGAGSSLFDYTVCINTEEPASWSVQVEEKEYELTEESHHGIYLNGVYSGTADVLAEPYETLSARKRADADERSEME